MHLPPKKKKKKRKKKGCKKGICVDDNDTLEIDSVGSELPYLGL